VIPQWNKTVTAKQLRALRHSYGRSVLSVEVAHTAAHPLSSTQPEPVPFAPPSPDRNYPGHKVVVVTSSPCDSLQHCCLLLLIRLVMGGKICPGIAGYRHRWEPPAQAQPVTQRASSTVTAICAAQDGDPVVDAPHAYVYPGFANHALVGVKRSLSLA